MGGGGLWRQVPSGREGLSTVTRGSAGRRAEWRGRQFLAADERVWNATHLSQCFGMACIAVFRSALLNGARRRELASCWRQHKRHQNTAARSAAVKSDRILESPFPVHTQLSDQNLSDFVWQDVGQWLSKPAVVRTA
jgi:hypothetical protein